MNDTLLKQVFHQSGEIDNVLLKHVFKQWVESMICCCNRCFSNGKSWCYVAETGVSATGKIGVTLLKQVFQQREKSENCDN